MELQDKVVVITGGSGGIGRALAAAFLAEGASAMVLADLDADAVHAAASELGCDGSACDVTDEKQVIALVDNTLEQYGRIDLFCSNAGGIGEGVLTDTQNELWQQQWELHVMSHLYAARAVLPSMIARGEGYLLQTVSAAGLLAAIESGPYTVTKAAALKLAEFLAITHGDDGIKVSALCPQWVDTALLPAFVVDDELNDIMKPDAMAQTVVAALREERFHVLPHPEVEQYVRRKGDDIDRWLSGMRRLRRR